MCEGKVLNGYNIREAKKFFLVFYALMHEQLRSLNP